MGHADGPAAPVQSLVVHAPGLAGKTVLLAPHDGSRRGRGRGDSGEFPEQRCSFFRGAVGAGAARPTRRWRLRPDRAGHGPVPTVAGWRVRSPEPASRPPSGPGPRSRSTAPRRRPRACVCARPRPPRSASQCRGWPNSTASQCHPTTAFSASTPRLPAVTPACSCRKKMPVFHSCHSTRVSVVFLFP
jgi:hypothetical protein